MDKPATCIACGQTSQEVPLFTLDFRGQSFSICPEHLPILIHRPSQLADRLPGLEELSPGKEPHD